MTVGVRLYDKLADPSSAHSVSAAYRRRRWQLVLQWFPHLAELSVVDLGGTASAWRSAPVRPRQLTIVNPEEPPTSVDELDDVLDYVQGDACDLPPSVRRTDFDLVYSN